MSKVVAALRRRGWKPEWLEIDRSAHTFNIEHPSITKEQSIEFYNEIFQGIGKEVLDLDEDTEKLVAELVALSSSKKKEE